MSSAEQFFSEYDSLQKTLGDEELEFWLIAQCETAAQENPDDGRMIGALYNELGAFYKHRGILEKAEEAFLKAKDASESLQDANYATIINNLAGNYRLRENFDEAISLFEQAIEIYKQHPETPREIYSSAYNNLALVYLDTGRFREAADMLQAAYDEMKDTPDCYFEKATAFANMAVAYYKCGETELMKEKLQMADELYQKGHLEDTSEYQAFVRLKEILQKQ